MRIRVLYFAVVRDLVGVSEEVLDLPADVRDVAAFARHITSAHPSLDGRMAHVRIARNEAFAGQEERLAEGDVLALIPPVAGG